jgi:hypothetical protein
LLDVALKLRLRHPLGVLLDALYFCLNIIVTRGRRLLGVIDVVANVARLTARRLSMAFPARFRRAVLVLAMAVRAHHGDMGRVDAPDRNEGCVWLNRHLVLTSWLRDL